MGGSGHFDATQSAGDFAHLERSLELLFPQLGKPRYSHRWAGRIAIIRDFLPHLHEPAPGITLPWDAMAAASPCAPASDAIWRLA